MQLPAIPDLPIPPLGIDIPTLVHPPLVHFAIVLPIVILLLEIYNLFTRRKSISAFSFLLLLVTIAVFVGAWLTGKHDGKEAFDLLSADGKAILKEHKLIGTYLVYGTGILVLFKIFAMSFRGWKSTFLYILLLIGFVAGTLYQGKEGGELVFEQGANNARVEELSDQVFDLKDELEDLKSEAKEKAPAAKTTEEKAAEPVKEEAPAATETPKKEEKAAEPAKEETKAPEKSEEAPAAAEPAKTEEAPAAAEETTPAEAKTPSKEEADEEHSAPAEESNATDE